MKIAIPSAGFAKRVRPQTWSKPKPLVSVAGVTALDHLLASLHSLPDPGDVEYVFILSQFLGETQIPAFMKERYPDYRVNYVVQTNMCGQSDALWLAREHLSGPMLMCFCDTLLETDFSFLANEKADSVAWVKSVPDPRRFGVVELDRQGWATRLVEKPTSLDNNLALVGCYYFREGRDLLSGIQEQMYRGNSLKGEYFLADAINIMIERGLKMRTHNVDVWLDLGTIEAILETNRYLLGHGRNNSPSQQKQDVTILPPVYIAEDATITSSTIGPFASIGSQCRIHNSRVEDSILEASVELDSVALKGSFIGRQAQVKGRPSDSGQLVLNIGDDSQVVLS